MRRGGIHVGCFVSLLGVSACGAKTGLEAPLPPPCVIEAIPPADCERVTRGEPTEIDGPRERNRVRFHRAHDGIVGYAYSRTDIAFYELDALGAPLAPPAVHRLPRAVEGVSTTSWVDGCAPAFALHVSPGPPPFSPGPCAFYVRGASMLRVLPGSYDRCVVTASEADGLRFTLTLGDRQETRRAGVDGTFLDREPIEAGPRAGDAFLERGAVRSQVFFDLTFVSADVVSPSGIRTAVPFGGRIDAVETLASTLFWARDGSLFSVDIDASGVPMLPPVRRTEFGADISAFVLAESDTGGWLLVERTSNAELLRVDRALAVRGPRLVVTLDSSTLVPTEDGLVLVGQSDGRLVSVPYACVD